MIANPMNLEGRTVLITGASSGIGRATSVLLSRLGAKTILAARNETRLQDTADLLEGRPFRVAPFDLAAGDEIPSWLESIVNEEGPLDGLVHSAGVHDTRPLRMTRTDHIEAVMNVNLVAGMMLAKGFRKKGVHADASSLVFLSSVMAIVGQPAISAYAASKGALKSLAKSLAMELAREGIRVNCVAPGHVRTEMAEALEESLPADKFAKLVAMHPLGIGHPIDVARAVAFLIADTGRWITGTTLVVDGGFTAH